MHTFLKALGTWGLPADIVAKAACALALFVLWSTWRSRDPKFGKRELVLAATVASAFASLAYVAFYLRGGPRIIDATSYYLEARALAEGHFTWPASLPSASFRGRFLLFGAHHLGVLFPPGYPLLLSFGFLLRAPLVIGPLIAAALVFTTAKLAELLAEDAGLVEHKDAIAKGAALFSLTSVALRYHTADTMAHGATALGITLAFYFALRARSSTKRTPLLLAGLALGFVLSARPVSALGSGLVVLWLVRHRARHTHFIWFIVGAVPFSALLLASQRANTGHLFSSVQRAYYALADGPPECFRYGFGKGVGCVYEHGDFVRAHLADGYGVVAALGTTLRRLKLHLLDVANFEPLALVVLFALRRRSAAVRAAFALIGLQMIAYAPFYFDGNYPGGGGRIFADILPLEHALLPMALLTMFSPLLPRFGAARILSSAVALSLLGFGVHGSFAHAELKNREGGRPMFDPEVVRKIDLNYGILFFDTDHGWNLAFDPDAVPIPKTKIVAARLRGDDHDRLLYHSLGKPPAFVYTYVPNGESKITPWAVPKASDTWHFAAEAEWPPLDQRGGYAVPEWSSASCVRGKRTLTLTASGPNPASATIAVPIPKTGRWSITPRVYVDETTRQSFVKIGKSASWNWDSGLGTGCHDLSEVTVAADAGELELTWTTSGIGHLDEIVVKKVE